MIYFINGLQWSGYKRFDWSVVVSGFHREQLKSQGKSSLPPFIGVVLSNEKADYEAAFAAVREAIGSYAEDGFVSCTAVWKTADGYLALSSGINIDGLREFTTTPTADDLVHELVVHTSETDPRTEDYFTYLTTPLP